MLLAGEDWYLVLEARAGSLQTEGTRYARVIAFEATEEGEPALRVWVAGLPPVTVEQLREQVQGDFVVVSLVHLSPEEVTALRAAGKWLGFTWA